MTEEFIHQLHIIGPQKRWTFDIPPGDSTVGRQAGNDLRLDHPLVSRRHALFHCTAEACHIADAGSSNGTAVDDRDLVADTPLRLAPGATIKIGPFQLTYHRSPLQADAAAEETPHFPATAGTTDAAQEPPAGRDEKKQAGEVPIADESQLEDDGPPAGEGGPADERRSGGEHQPPAGLPPQPPVPGGEEPSEDADGFIPPGLSRYSRRYLNYLPGIYHTDFMSRFLAMFESILVPIEWNVDNFDLYLSPETAPVEFLPWLANWFELLFDDTWDEVQRRALLVEAHRLFARRGTRWALRRILEIYLSCDLEIDDQDPDLDPFTFHVNISLPEQDVDTTLVERIVDMNKPAHTTYKLRFKR